MPWYEGQLGQGCGRVLPCCDNWAVQQCHQRRNGAMTLNRDEGLSTLPRAASRAAELAEGSCGLLRHARIV